MQLLLLYWQKAQSEDSDGEDKVYLWRHSAPKRQLLYTAVVLHYALNVKILDSLSRDPTSHLNRKHTVVFRACKNHIWAHMTLLSMCMRQFNRHKMDESDLKTVCRICCHGLSPCYFPRATLTSPCFSGHEGLRTMTHTRRAAASLMRHTHIHTLHCLHHW